MPQVHALLHHQHHEGIAQGGDGALDRPDWADAGAESSDEYAGDSGEASCSHAACGDGRVHAGALAAALVSEALAEVIEEMELAKEMRTREQEA